MLNEHRVSLHANVRRAKGQHCLVLKAYSQSQSAVYPGRHCVCVGERDATWRRLAETSVSPRSDRFQFYEYGAGGPSMQNLSSHGHNKKRKIKYCVFFFSNIALKKKTVIKSEQ